MIKSVAYITNLLHIFFFKNRGKYVSEQRENKEARKYILDMGKEGWSQ